MLGEQRRRADRERGRSDRERGRVDRERGRGRGREEVWTELGNSRPKVEN